MEYDRELVLSNWEACKSHTDTLYDDCNEDWEFLHAKNQWDAKDKEKRNKQGRPALTLNQLLPYAQQVTNDIRQSRLAIRVSPVDSDADIDTAEIYQGIIRNIEKQSNAQSVYATAAMNAVGAGIGWIEIETDWADTQTFDQEIFIRRVLDFQSAYLDPNSQEIDGSDAEYGFIRIDYTEDRFKELWPDREAISFEDGTDDDMICVMKYYAKHYEQSKIHQIRLVDGSLQVITDEQKEILDENGTVEYEIVMTREVETPYVKMCILNGEEEPLEEEDFPSEYIPLIPVIGEEVFIDGQREYHSLIRQAKDAQKMYNYWKTSNTEMIALQPKTPWVGAKGSFKSQPMKWKNANSENYSTLEYDLVYSEDGQLVPPPQRSQPAQGSMSMMQEAMSAKEDIRLAIGMPQANMGERGNEVSGIAIRSRQVEGDNATFHFIDNLSNSIAHVGRIIVSMIPAIYSERKVMRILGEDGEEKNVPVNQPYVKEAGQERPAQRGDTKVDGIYDLSAGKYDVTCDVGASYSSKRQEEADKLIELIQAKPELMEVVGDLLFKALDVPNGQEIADRLQANMPPEMLGENPMADKLKQAGQAIQALQEQLKNYDAALKEKKENQEFEEHYKLKELELDRDKFKLDVMKANADIEKMRAETTNFNMEAVNELGGVVNNLATDFSDMREALEIIVQSKEDEALEGNEGVTGEPLEQSPVMPEEGEE